MESNCKLFWTGIWGNGALDRPVHRRGGLCHVTGTLRAYVQWIKPHINAVTGQLKGCVDFAKFVKVYGVLREGEQRYSPAEVADAVPTSMMGRPSEQSIWTSRIELHRAPESVLKSLCSQLMDIGILTDGPNECLPGGDDLALLCTGQTIQMDLRFKWRSRFINDARCFHVGPLGFASSVYRNSYRPYAAGEVQVHTGNHIEDGLRSCMPPTGFIFKRQKSG
jgi:hypothetical protein